MGNVEQLLRWSKLKGNMNFSVDANARVTGVSQQHVCGRLISIRHHGIGLHHHIMMMHIVQQRKASSPNHDHLHHQPPMIAI